MFRISQFSVFILKPLKSIELQLLLHVYDKQRFKSCILDMKFKENQPNSLFYWNVNGNVKFGTTGPDNVLIQNHSYV